MKFCSVLKEIRDLEEAVLVVVPEEVRDLDKVVLMGFLKELRDLEETVLVVVPEEVRDLDKVVLMGFFEEIRDLEEAVLVLVPKEVRDLDKVVLVIFLKEQRDLKGLTNTACAMSGKMLFCIYCRHMGYSFRLTARVILYAPSHRQDSTYHGLCYTSRRALAGTRNSSMGLPHEGSIR